MEKDKVDPGAILKALNQAAYSNISFVDSNDQPLDYSILQKALEISYKQGLSLKDRNKQLMELEIHLKIRGGINCSLKQLIERATPQWRKLVFHCPPEEQLQIEGLNDSERNEVIAESSLQLVS